MTVVCWILAISLSCHSLVIRRMEGCDHIVVHTPCPCSSFYACIHRSVEQLSNKVIPLTYRSVIRLT